MHRIIKNNMNILCLCHCIIDLASTGMVVLWYTVQFTTWHLTLYIMSLSCDMPRCSRPRQYAGMDWLTNIFQCLRVSFGFFLKKSSYEWNDLWNVYLSSSYPYLIVEHVAMAPSIRALENLPLHSDPAFLWWWRWRYSHLLITLSSLLYTVQQSIWYYSCILFSLFSSFALV